MSSTEGLQIAQIIADLQTLQNAEPQASFTLLTPLKSLPPSTNGTASPHSRLNSPPKFDKLGRRIVGPISRTPPSLGRAGSSASMSSLGLGSTYGSGTATPVIGGSGAELDEDLKRAKTLLELFEMRGKFKQMGDTGLTRAKQRVDDVVTKYAKADLDEREKAARARHLGV